MGHDLSFPFNMVKRGWRAVDVPGARATEKMVPSIEGEWARKRRMMSHAWPIVLRGGLLDPRGYPPLYALMVLSHRVLRYATPLLHVVAARRDARCCSRAGGRAVAAARAGGAAGGRRGRRPRALAAAAARPLLRAHDRLAGRRPLRPPAPRHRRRAGTRRRARGEPVPAARRRKRALDVRRRAARRSLLAAPRAGASRRWRSGSRAAGTSIYRQRRVGRDGVPFDLYKLRTMVTGAETMGAGLIVDAGDERITRVGALLRRTSLDELPNLINVLRGEMSLVGPRPTVQVQVDRYTERQRHRLDARPGITGWAQVNGRASLPWHERIELDLSYLEHASLRLDLRILAASVRMVRHGRGLYRGETGGWREPPPRPTAGLGDLLGALVDVARRGRSAARRTRRVVQLGAGERVAPRRGGDGGVHAGRVLEQQHVVAVGLGEQRLELVDVVAPGCPACTGRRCGRARACGRACRARGASPGA